MRELLEEVLADAAVQATLGALSEIGIEGVEALPDLEDASAEAGMRVLVTITPVAFFAAPPAFAAGAGLGFGCAMIRRGRARAQ